MYLNYRKSIAVFGTAAAVVGLGGTALAVTGSDTVPGTSATSAAKAKPADKPGDKGEKSGKHGKGGLLKRLEHGQFVTKGKGGVVTHTIWRGSVTAVSPTSITVQAADKKTQTYAVTKDTKIKQRAKGAKPTDSSIAKIAKGDTVTATGVGTPKVTAKVIVELAK